ncbi:hypothetical protein IW261DRAFT_1424871 [Armillaria novae-zelandiae]|uniref:Uncharacterized protein n=1 Tax=Armillaria novae-zelandiae TaxID=153914 RepID=A0AA39NUF3_9AGAR|nr:hypothetical protein IW261DRAFT_1424871 [Armillaria novae-zelandiae]
MRLRLIRVWDTHIAATPNECLEIFGLDIVDVSGHPQAVNTCIKVIVGARPGYVPEKEGNVITALDDIGASTIYSRMDSILSSTASTTICSTSQLQSGKHAGHKWSPVSAGPDQLVKILDLQCVTFRMHIWVH